MDRQAVQNNRAIGTNKKDKITLKTLYNQRYLILMTLPFVVWVIIFRYIPLWGWTMAFQNYKPHKTFFEQSWVGFQQFRILFSEPRFYLVLRNTLAMSFLSITVGFTVPIIFALLLNEIKVIKFKRTVQTISYLPHFVSWVVVASLVTSMLSTDGGIVNTILLRLGIFKTPTNLLTKPSLFWIIVTVADMWKSTGWNAIIYLAAIAGIDQEIYEAAKVDGANRFKQMWHITLPGIRPTIMVILIMSIGHLINIGFERQFLLGNSLVQEYSEVLDWYALNYGIGMFRYSYGTAIGIFKSVVSIILLFGANKLAAKMGEGKIM
jgi:putative aldouronate transport system permease protein